MNARAAKGFDIAPFALPDCPPGEVWFEEPRDIQRLIVTFAGKPPAEAKLQYLRKAWPKDRIERSADADLVRPSMFGWMRIDDWFNTTWCDAAVNVRRAGPRELAFTFQGLLAEMRDFPDAEHYDVTFRRTLGVRVAGDAQVKRVQVFTRSAARRSRLRVELDAGRKTPGRRIEPGGYNARGPQAHRPSRNDRQGHNR